MREFKGPEHQRDFDVGHATGKAKEPERVVMHEECIRDTSAFHVRHTEQVQHTVRAVHAAFAANDLAAWRKAQAKAQAELVQLHVDAARAEASVAAHEVSAQAMYSRTREQGLAQARERGLEFATPAHEASEARTKLREATSRAETALHAALAQPAPRGYEPLARDGELMVALAIDPEAPAQQSYAEAEAKFTAVAKALTPALAKSLAARLQRDDVPGDQVAQAFRRLTQARRGRILDVLAEAPRRAAQQAAFGVPQLRTWRTADEVREGQPAPAQLARMADGSVRARGTEAHAAVMPPVAEPVIETASVEHRTPAGQSAAARSGVAWRPSATTWELAYAEAVSAADGDVALQEQHLAALLRAFAAQRFVIENHLRMRLSAEAARRIVALADGVSRAVPDPEAARESAPATEPASAPRVTPVNMGYNAQARSVAPLPGPLQLPALPGALTGGQSHAAPPVRPLHGEYVHARDPRLWNWVKVEAVRGSMVGATLDADAPVSTLEVARWLFPQLAGATASDLGIIDHAPYYQVPVDVALTHPELARFAPQAVALRGVLRETVDSQLMATSEAAWAEVTGDEHARSAMRTGAPKAARGHASSHAAHNQVRLVALRQTLNAQLPVHATSAVLAPALAWTTRHAEHHDAAMEPALTIQARRLTRLLTLAQQGTALGNAAPVVTALQAVARAAAMAHLPDEGEACLVEAEGAMRALPVELALAALTATAPAHQGPGARDAAAFAGLQGTGERLAADLRQAPASAATRDHAAWMVLATQEAIQRHTLHLLEDELEGLAVALERNDASIWGALVNDARYRAMPGQLRAAKAKVVHRLAALAQIATTATVAHADNVAEQLQQRGAGIEVGRSLLADLRNDQWTQHLITWAQQEHTSSVVRQQMAKLFVLIGVSVATAGAGAWAGGAVEGASLARTAATATTMVRGAQVAGAVVSIAVDAGLTGVAQTAIMGGEAGSNLVENLLGSAMGHVALRVLGSIAGKLGSLPAAQHAPVATVGAGARLTVEFVTTAVLGQVAAKLVKAPHANEATVESWAWQAAAMVTGRWVARHCVESMARLRKAGLETGAAMALLQKQAALAKQVARQGSPEAAGQLLERHAEVLQHEAAALAKVSPGAGLSAEALATWKASVAEQQTAVASHVAVGMRFRHHGLKSVDAEGLVWIGSSKEIDGMFGEARTGLKAGAYDAATGRRHWTAELGGQTFTLYDTPASAAAPKSAAPHSDAALRHAVHERIAAEWQATGETPVAFAVEVHDSAAFTAAYGAEGVSRVTLHGGRATLHVRREVGNDIAMLNHEAAHLAQLGREAAVRVVASMSSKAWVKLDAGARRAQALVMVEAELARAQAELGRVQANAGSVRGREPAAKLAAEVQAMSEARTALLGLDDATLAEINAGLRPAPAILLEAPGLWARTHWAGLSAALAPANYAAHPAEVVTDSPLCKPGVTVEHVGQVWKSGEPVQAKVHGVVESVASRRDADDQPVVVMSVRLPDGRHYTQTLPTTREHMLVHEGDTLVAGQDVAVSKPRQHRLVRVTTGEQVELVTETLAQRRGAGGGLRWQIAGSHNNLAGEVAEDAGRVAAQAHATAANAAAGRRVELVLDNQTPTGAGIDVPLVRFSGSVEAPVATIVAREVKHKRIGAVPRREITAVRGERLVENLKRMQREIEAIRPLAPEERPGLWKGVTDVELNAIVYAIGKRNIKIELVLSENATVSAATVKDVADAAKAVGIGNPDVFVSHLTKEDMRAAWQRRHELEASKGNDKPDD